MEPRDLLRIILVFFAICICLFFVAFVVIYYYLFAISGAYTYYLDVASFVTLAIACFIIALVIKTGHWFVPVVALLEILFLMTSHVLVDYFPLLNAQVVHGYGSTAQALHIQPQPFLDLVVVVLSALVFIRVFFQSADFGGLYGLFKACQFLSVLFIPLGVEIFFFDHGEFYIHAATLVTWFTNADLFYASVLILVVTTVLTYVQESGHSY